MGGGYLVETVTERWAGAAAEDRLDLGERAPPVVPEEPAADGPGVGHHPELLAGVEVVGVAVDPQQLPAAGAAAGDRRGDPGQRAQVHAAEVRETDAAGAYDRARKFDQPVGPTEGRGGQRRIAEE